MLTAFGSDMMKKAIENIHSIHGLFNQEFMHRELEDWTAGQFGQFDAINILNRYFTRCSEMNGEAPIQFSHAVDPENILTNALSNDFIHIQENVVEYYEALERTIESSESIVTSFEERLINKKYL